MLLLSHRVQHHEERLTEPHHERPNTWRRKRLLGVGISHQRFGSLSVVLYLHQTSYEPLIIDTTPFYRLFEVTLNYTFRVHNTNLVDQLLDFTQPFTQPFTA